MFAVIPFISILFISTTIQNSIFDFKKDCRLDNWYIVNDGVMGGLSESSFRINEDGHGFFQGNISLANYGGFASVRHNFASKDISKFSTIVIKLKGDGKKYQFRVKNNEEYYYSYTLTFKTSGEWESIEIPLSSMVPTFRGRVLDMPNFNHSELEELAILIGNKKEENFKLLIDHISLK